MKTYRFFTALIFFTSLIFQTMALSFDHPGEKVNRPLSNPSVVGSCPNSNGIDSDSDGADDHCDLDDDNDGIPDTVECPNIPINFAGFNNGNFAPGDSDEERTTYSNGEDLPLSLMLTAPEAFGGASEVRIRSEENGQLLRLQDQQEYISNTGLETTLTISKPYSFIFSATAELSSRIDLNDALEIIPINPIAGFSWTVVSSNAATINVSGNNNLKIMGNNNNSFAEFEIRHQGFCNGFRIRLTNLFSSTFNSGSQENSASFALSICADTDSDGIINALDLDSDNDGILDVDEAGHPAEDLDHDGRIDGQDYEFDDNGLFDDLETFPESGLLNYSIENSELAPDEFYDAYEMDADGDGCFDTSEENIDDPDNDGLAGSGEPSINTDGLVTTINYANPLYHYWKNPSIGPCLEEICNDGIDNDGDDLIDCFDCADCAAAAGCTDQDQDGINDYCDLDDDNDGITDTNEGRCKSSLRLIGWSHNRDDPAGFPKGHFKPAFDDLYVASAEDETNGPGNNIGLIYSNLLISGLNSSSLSESITNEDYLPYTFRTTSSWTEQIEVNSVSHYNALELQNQDASYNFSILYSTDGFTTSQILIKNVQVRPLDIHILDVLETAPIPLLPATDYEFRVYFYNLKGHTVIGWDDFSLGGCQHSDTDQDGIFDFKDLDSDADDCVDAIEGDGSINLLDLINDTISGGVSSQGIPLAAGSNGQGVGTSNNTNQQADACNVCDEIYHVNESCDNNDPCTVLDSVTVSMVDGSVCIPCRGIPASCSTGPSSIVACDDDNILTINDQQTILDCDGTICLPCAGTPVNCNNGTTSIVSCNDNNPCTENDQQTILDSDGSICVPCTGSLIDCSNGTTSVMTCDDGNIFTINDLQTILNCDNSICIPCRGTPVDCNTGTTSIVNCDDNDPCTKNDIQTVLDRDGSICIPCAGTPQDCSNGTTSLTACDDGNIFTINDLQEILDCNGEVCGPCQGTPVDCSTGTTSVISCNDNNNCTINDSIIILDSDGSICRPCVGSPVDCSNAQTSVLPCDDGDEFTINDQETVIICNGSVCLPCQGTPVDCNTGATTSLPCDDGNPCTTDDFEIILNSDQTVCVPCGGTSIEMNDPQIEDIIICQNEPLPTAIVTNGHPAAIYAWYDKDPASGNNPVFTGRGAFSHSLDNAIAGKHDFWVVQKIENCQSDPILFQILIETVPVVDAGDDEYFDCVAGEVMLTGQVALDDFTVLWAGPDSTMQNNIIDPLVGENGWYFMEITDPTNGCVAVDSVFIIPADRILAFDDQLNIFEGEIHQIDILANDSLDSYNNFTVKTFNLSGGNILVNDENVIYYTPELLGTKRAEKFTYEVCAIECPEICAQAEVTIDIATRNVYIPNAFSPNGDGHNDFFFVSGDETIVREIRKIGIFNRWGAQVFGKNNIPINDPQFGWDGLFKDKNADQNVFIYFVEIEFIDGSTAMFNGDVTILK